MNFVKQILKDMKSIVKIGRDKSNDIEINEPRISRNHAIITDLGDGSFEIKDLGSTNGTFVNGERITQKIISPNDEVKVATSLVNWHKAFTNAKPDEQQSNINEEPFSKIRKTITIGTSLENDLVLSDSFVSNHHAEISLLKDGNYYIRDLNSSNGSFVNGTRITAKNFTKTDTIKIASTSLPSNWFLHKKLLRNLFRDNYKTWITLFSLLILSALSILVYFNRCKWLNWDCSLSANQIYDKTKNSLVHIVHDYYYTINYHGKTYYVGKNKLFKVTEANTSKENLNPYNSVTGSGCFIRNDGTILTSAFIANPWLNTAEKNIMLQEVFASKTIPHFSLNEDFQVCGETENIKWLANGLIDNDQNYVAATSNVSCQAVDSSSMIINSVKKELPPNAKALQFAEVSAREDDKSHRLYYSIESPINRNSLLKDTFYLATDSFKLDNPNTIPFDNILNSTPEGSIFIDDRGNLIGNIQQQKIISIQNYFNK